MSISSQNTNLEICPGKITMGQGEYAIFHNPLNAEKRELSPETFEQVYKVLIQYSPGAMANSGSEYLNRYELIKEKIKVIDPMLEAVFIPRTLYELFFIRKCIEEDLEQKEICNYLAPANQKITLKSFKGNQQQYDTYQKNKAIEQTEKKCWHLGYFTDAGDNEHAGVKNVAYRLNKVMIETLKPLAEGFTHQEFSTFTENEIDFLKAHYENDNEAMEKSQKGEKVEKIGSLSYPGPTTNFGIESIRGSIKPMGIRNETDAQIIRHAVALDCSKIAQHSLFLYRGADFQKDSPISWIHKENAYSLSYGTSLFAGCIYDGGATAFYYMRNEKNAYALPIRFDQIKDSPFYVPTTHTVTQLFGDGEIFHARTKAWKEFDLKKLDGMDICVGGHIRDHLKSNLSKDEFTAQFQNYKNNAFQLK